MIKQRKQELIKRFRKVSWGRLYWKSSNPHWCRWDREDICLVKNGAVNDHYHTLDALEEDIAYAERLKERSNQS